MINLWENDYPQRFSDVAIVFLEGPTPGAFEGLGRSWLFLDEKGLRVVVAESGDENF
jgi:hypothetical protein